MNYRLQFVPLPGMRELPLPQNKAVEIPATECENARLFHSWAIYDSDFGPIRSSGWDSLLGLTLAFGVGVGFWTAAGLLIARFW